METEEETQLKTSTKTCRNNKNDSKKSANFICVEIETYKRLQGVWSPKSMKGESNKEDNKARPGTKPTP